MCILVAPYRKFSARGILCVQPGSVLRVYCIIHHIYKKSKKKERGPVALWLWKMLLLGYYSVSYSIGPAERIYKPQAFLKYMPQTHLYILIKQFRGKFMCGDAWHTRRCQNQVFLCESKKINHAVVLHHPDWQTKAWNIIFDMARRFFFIPKGTLSGKS